MTRRLQRGDRLVVATHNPGKVWEINKLIEPYGLAAVSAGELGLDEPVETETTFVGNARLKALFAAGAFRPRIDRTYPLEQVVDALKWVDEGHAKGKVIVAVDGRDATTTPA